MYTQFTTLDCSCGWIPFFWFAKEYNKTKVDMQINDPDVHIPDWKVSTFHSGIYTGFVACYTAMS